MIFELINGDNYEGDIVLNSENHIYNSYQSNPGNPKVIEACYGLADGKISYIFPIGHKFPGKIRNYGREYLFTDFKHFFVSNDNAGYNIIIYYLGDKHWWEPLQERLKREEFFEEHPNMIMYSWGYIDGLDSYLGKFLTQGLFSATSLPGYQMWQEVTVLLDKDDEIINNEADLKIKV